MRLNQFAAGLFAPKATERPSVWAVRELVLPAPFDTNGPKIDLDLGPFIAEPIDWIAETGEEELALCFGSQAGKTLILTAIRAWAMMHRPCVWGVMWPVAAKVQEYTETRWRPGCEQSPAMDRIRKRGKSDWKVMSQKFEKGMTLFYGSNSPSMLASTPMQVVEIDEGDKAADKTLKEASSVELFPHRIKKAVAGRIIRASTPTVPDGFIWKYFLAGDQRRWFVPCPCCQKEVTFVFDAKQTQLPIVGGEASVVIPDECRVDGEFDVDRVRALAFIRCPHCEGEIRDGNKIAMNRKGRWKATNPRAAKGRRSYHLSSLFVPGPRTSIGAVAAEFIEAKRDGTLQNTVNGMLAEPHAGQSGEAEFRPETAEGVTPGATSWLQMTVDVQDTHEWCLICRTDLAGNLTAIHAERTNGWQEVRDLQLSYGIIDTCVWIDAGGGNQSRVFGACMDYGRPVQLPGRNLPVHFGWSPCRGEPKKYFRDPLAQGGQSLWHFIYADPYAGHSLGIAGKMQVPVYEIATHGAKDVFDDLKHGRLKTAKFEVLADIKGNVSKAELWKHLEGEQKVLAFLQNRTTYIWKVKSRRTPNHLLDCCVYQLAMQQHQKRIRQAMPQQGAANERKTLTVSR